MTSVRSSGRVGLPSDDYLVGAGDAAIARADGHHPSGVSYGGRQLARIRAQLSDRDFAVLHSLAALKFARTEALRRLHFDGTGLTPQSAHRQVRRTLTGLYQLHLIERLQRRIGGVRAGSASYVYKLSAAGARLIGDTNRRRSREPSLAHLEHVLAVTELVVQLHERTRAGDVDLLGIETEPDCWRRFVGHHGATITLKPDLRVTIGVGSHELHWFVEVDRGTEGPKALQRQIMAYLHAWQDGGEETRAGVFPRVLWAAPDNRRALAITRVWRSVTGIPDGMFAATTVDAAVAVLTARPDGSLPGAAS